jgi:hypothetical protein
MLSQNVWKMGHQIIKPKNAMQPARTTRARPLRGSHFVAYISGVAANRAQPSGFIHSGCAL